MNMAATQTIETEARRPRTRAKKVGSISELPATQATAVVAAPGTPMAMLQLAIQQGADLDKLEKLMGLQDRWEKNEARKQFVAAMAEFKKHPLEIHKNKGADFENRSGGRTKYKYATLENVCKQIIAGLSAVGISHDWKTSQEAKVIKVTCVLTHVAGHSESTSLEAAPDESGGKNAIQAIGSTVTYLSKYTLLAATGIAVKDQDDADAGPGKHNASNTAPAAPRQPEKKPAGKPAYTDKQLSGNLDAWTQLMNDRVKTAGQIISMIQSKYTLTPAQMKQIRDKEPKQ